MFGLKKAFLLKIFSATCLFWSVVNRFNFNSKPNSIEDIREIIQRLNEEQNIYNFHKFGPLTNDTIIIAIQVHDRLLYLRWVITSLSKVRDINTTLLIFSHDWYDDAINELVRSIQFAMVLQIFYPYSVQLHPHGFPGPDPYYCEDELPKNFSNISRNNSSQKCYIPAVVDRDANLVQIKHHWWWKTNSIFSRLECTVNHTGSVLFLEDDHYVLPDLIHMLHLLRAKAVVDCPQCEMLSIGRACLDFVFRNDSHKLEIRTWHKSFQNVGLTMNRTMWQNIVKMQRTFCRFNDYNWDASLFNMSYKRIRKGPFKVLTVKAPRVFHIGKCGVHFRRSKCGNVWLMKVIRIMARTCRHKMFPANLTIVDVEGPSVRMRRKEAGGWKDRRDRELCVNMTKMQRLSEIM